MTVAVGVVLTCPVATTEVKVGLGVFALILGHSGEMPMDLLFIWQALRKRIPTKDVKAVQTRIFLMDSLSMSLHLIE
jgi:hypothetical protein